MFASKSSTVDSRAIFVAEILDLPFDQVQRVELLCDTGEAQLGCATLGQA
jgi:hypothetical protein